MSKVIDISGRLTEEKPKLKISEDKIYEIDDRKNTVIKFEQETKNVGVEDIGFIDTMVETFLGKKAAKEINDMELSMGAYQSISIAIMSAITQEDYKVAEKRYQDGKSL